jgi:hypothetical protein
MDVYGQRGYFDPWLDGVHHSISGEVDTVRAAYKLVYQRDEIDRLAAFAEYVGAEVMIEVNVATCDPDMWADMVRYTNLEKGYAFRYWELGNELDLESVERPLYPWPVEDEYVSRYRAYYEALKGVDRGIRIVGPATAGHDPGSYPWPFENLINPLTLDPDIASGPMLDVFSYHYYPWWNGGGHVVTHKELFAFTHSSTDRSRSHAHACVAGKRSLLDQRGFADTPIAITEFNAIAADRYSSLVFNHANALYMADMLGRLAFHGADMVMHWELYDAPLSSRSSFGLIDHNSSSISINNYSGGVLHIQDNFTPMPVYYAYLMYAQLFGDQLVGAYSSMEDVLSIWASTDSEESGGIQLMVTNLSEEPIQGCIDLGSLVVHDAIYYELHHPGFAVAKDKETITEGTMINGLCIDAGSAYSIYQSTQEILDSGIPMDVEPGATGVNHVFPPYSATAILVNSSPWATTLEPPTPLPPDGIDPVDGAQGVATTSIMGWNPRSLSDSYHLQIATDADFEDLAVDEPRLAVNYYKLPPLPVETTYYWRVNATNPLGTSDWSPAWIFTTCVLQGVPVQVAAEDQPMTFRLHQNAPNPFNRITRIAYDLPEPSDVILTVYTLTGQEVVALVWAHQRPGCYEVAWDGSGCATGVYFYRLKAGGFVQTKRMILLQ